MKKERAADRIVGIVWEWNTECKFAPPRYGGWKLKTF